MKGYLMQMQPFSVNDGDGIRTTIFLAGCPLHCKWCANPEGLRQHPVVGFYARLCIGCGACAAVCPKGIGIDLNAEREKCVSCGACVAACPKGARKALVSLADADEIIAEAAKHQLFYRNSGGGVTLSGGEVLAQAAFALDLMAACKRYGIHLALETSGFGKREDLLALADAADCLFYDVKHADDDVHRELTGQGCGLILDNLDAVLDRAAGKLTVRLPLIPGLNDDEGHLENFARTIKALGRVQAVELLPYHRLGKNKYALLGRAYALESLGPMSKEDLARRAAFVAERLGGTKVLF